MRKHHTHTTNRRRGVAAVEFAVCLPVLVLVVFASVEACTMIFLRESLTVAAYESGRVALEKEVAAADVIARGDALLTERSVSGGVVQVSPSDLTTVAAGETIQITVSAPCEANAVSPVWFYGGKSLTSTVTVIREY